MTPIHVHSEEVRTKDGKSVIVKAELFDQKIFDMMEEKCRISFTNPLTNHLIATYFYDLKNEREVEDAMKDICNNIDETMEVVYKNR